MNQKLYPAGLKGFVCKLKNVVVFKDYIISHLSSLKQSSQSVQAQILNTPKSYGEVLRVKIYDKLQE